MAYYPNAVIPAGGLQRVATNDKMSDSPTTGPEVIDGISDEVEAITAELGANVSGTYPDLVARLNDVLTTAFVTNSADLAANQPSLRTLGSGSRQAAAGDHAHAFTAASDFIPVNLQIGDVPVFDGTHWVNVSFNNLKAGSAMTGWTFGAAVASLATNVWDRTPGPNSGETIRPLSRDYSASTQGTVWHVNNATGSDANAGSAGAPFKTLSRAFQAASTGHTIVVHAGTYRERIEPPTGGTTKGIWIQVNTAEAVYCKGSLSVGTGIGSGAASASGHYWTSTPSNGWKLNRSLAVTITGGNTFTAASGNPFTSAMVGTIVTGTGVARGTGSATGGSAAQTTVTVAAPIGSTTFTVADRSAFPQSGNFSAKVDNETVTVTGGWGTGPGTFNLSAPTTAAHSSGAWLVAGTLIDGAAAWTTNQWAGCLVRINSGVGAGQWARVASNSATTLFLDGQWITTPSGPTLVAPTATSAYEIVAVVTAVSGASSSDVTRFSTLTVSGTSTNASITASFGQAGGLIRRPMIALNDSGGGYDPGMVNTSAGFNTTAGEPATLFVDSKKLKRIPWSSTTTPLTGQYMYDPATQSFYSGTDPTTATLMEVTEYSNFLNASFSGGKLRGLAIMHYGGPMNVVAARSCLYLSGGGYTVEGCVIALNSGYGISSFGSNVIVQDSVIFQNGANGAHAFVVPNYQLLRNRIAWNNDEFFEVGLGKGTFGQGIHAAVKVTGAFAGGKFDQNIVHDNNANGLWFDLAVANVATQPAGMTDVVVSRNIVLNNDTTGIEIELSDRASVVGNVVVGNGRDGIKLSSCPGVRVWHNTVYDNGWSGPTQGTGGKWWSDTSFGWEELVHWVDSRYINNSAGVVPWAHVNPPTGGPFSGVTLSPAPGDVRNNLFISTNRSGNASTRLLSAKNQSTVSTQRIDATQIIGAQDFNGYFRINGSGQPSTLIRYENATAASVNYASLTAFKTANPGREAGLNVFADGVAVGTILNNVAGGDYAPTPTASGGVADALGAALPADVAALLGKTNATSYKIGADTSGLLVPAFA